MEKVYELNDDVIDCLQDKIDSILAIFDHNEMDDGQTYNLFDVEFEWGSTDHEMVTVCIAQQLLKKWSLYDTSLQCSFSTLQTLEDFYNILAPKGLNRHIFSEKDTPPISYLEYHLLNYIVGEVEIAALVAKKKCNNMVLSNEDNENRNRIAFQLDKLCKLLHIEINDISSTEEIVQHIVAAVARLNRDNSATDINLLPKLLAGLKAQSISVEQHEKLREIENAFYQDFLIRRQMMLKRLEVTLNSFLGENPVGISIDDPSNKLRTAILSQQKYLERAPLHYKIDDALHAPLSLAIEQTMKVTGAVHVGEKSLVKKVIVGHVPDRGGRVNELRQKRLDIQATQKYSQGHNRGGGISRSRGGQKDMVKTGQGSDSKLDNASSNSRIVVVTENGITPGGHSRKNDNAPHRKKERR